ncbi:MAG: chromosome segregation protein SMC [Proteobacteria bacterium]|nr:chromosome segregation protein SMC [Pseudomonadota bacterium]
MRLKSLQLHGFKSFVDRTTFQFRDGINCVVGPNGCGKSNVVDAVRWVMGEQSPRRLRGKGMEDVIFAGAENRPPIGMAEVVLTFDNGDGQAPAPFASYAEIQVARRLYRSGESEYLLNKTPCRMRDIQDFLRDTGIGAKGYTIVEQGKVAEVVSARPEDRRMLIEDAAGIAKYKARRREAESKIASTEQNLTRVNDVLGEIRRQIASIERQARKAARYKRLRETQRVLELSLAADERRSLHEKVAEAEQRRVQLRDELTAMETRLSERELSLQEKQIALAEAEKALNAGSEALYALRSEIKQLESQIEFGRRERESLAESNAGRAEELERLREQLETATREAQTAEDELRTLDESLAAEAQAIAAAEAEAHAAGEALHGLERDREQASQALVEILTGIARGEDRAATVEDRRSQIELRLRSADEELSVQQSEAARVDREQASLEDGLRNLLADRDRLQETLRKSLRDHHRATEENRLARERAREIRDKRETRKARWQSLREVLDRREDVGDGARHLLEQADADDRFALRGLVRDLLEAEPEVESAVEAVLAERAQALVVGHSDGALQALQALRGSDAGQGVFLLEPPEEPATPGIVPLGVPLLERVRARPGFDGVARSLLAGVYFVESLDEVLSIYGGGRIPATFATAAGDVVTPDGVIRGGGTGSGTGMLARVRETRELEAEVEALDRQVEEADRAQQQAEATLARAGDELENLRNRHHTAALAVANHEKDLERTRDRVKALGEAQEGRVAERSELLAELEALAEERDRLGQRLETSRAERVRSQAALDAVGLRISTAGRELTRLENRATELRVAHEGRTQSRQRLEETALRSRQSLTETGQWISRRESEIASAEERRAQLAGEVEAAESSLARKLQDEETARVDLETKRQQYDRESAGVRELEGEARELRTGLTGRREAAAAAELVVRESELELRHLDEAMREKWDVELASWTPPTATGEPEPAAAETPPDGESEEAPTASDSAQALRDARENAEWAVRPRAERESRLEEIRKKIQSLGDVNLGAIEEHEELAERFRFLGEQKQDLETTIASLREAIARINRTSRRRFRETFELVSKHFSENFPRLFGGGKASLVLTEAEDVLEAGVDITAQPPGKRLQNVNLLSGGEKTMTALALLVAVFQVRPSPFFLLDEVDAALDDANVGRFNQIITELADASQFLVITHNKRTIEVADILYGVTMEQKGVSKLVAVELAGS